jgi:hypothetical protein
MTTAQEQGQKLSFPCTCNGCRNYPKGNRLEQNYWQGLVLQLESNYFSPNNRAFHGSRITDWNNFYTGHDVYGLSIKETRRAYEGREYAVSLWCRYGSLVDSIKQESARSANKFMKSDEALEMIKSCSCHGCQLDKAGR